MIANGPDRLGEQVYLVGGPIDVGKFPDSDLRLEDELVSRSHCRLLPTASGWRIEDRKSTNGLFVNGERIANRDLRHGDRIRIGSYELTYLMANGGPPDPPAGAESRETPPVKEPDDGTYRIADDLDDLRSLSTGEKVSLTPVTSAGAAGVSADEIGDGAGPVCPSCRKHLSPRAKLCVDCGINLKTGRGILTAQDSDLDQTYATTEQVIRWLSWVFPLGYYPFASEAFGTRKPWVIRTIALVTIFTSLWFLAYEWTGSPRMQSLKNLMLWAGEGEYAPDELRSFYTFEALGDAQAFEAKRDELTAAHPDLESGQAILAAHEALPPEQQCLGRYRTSQLITHAFLHGDIMHLVGNLLFLLVFGSRVNALIGNTLTLILYPALAAGAALVHMTSLTAEPPVPMVGASGVIMGLAGMYLVLFPVHRIHMAVWFRWGLAAGFRLMLKLWAVRGFWVVLFYIAFDVVYTAIGIDDGTAHWAHLGGFGLGVAIALVLLAARLVNARSCDILSMIFGRYAWSLVGPPTRGVRLLQRLP